MKLKRLAATGLSIVLGLSLGGGVLPPGGSGLTANERIRAHARALPSKYSMVDLGQVPSIKSQSGHGTCWVFSAIASIETGMIRAGVANKNINLSEQHLVWFTYPNDMLKDSKITSPADLYGGRDRWQTDNGSDPYETDGNLMMLGSTLARGFGPVDESKEKYNGFKSKHVSLKKINWCDYRITTIDQLPDPAYRDEEGRYIKTNINNINKIKRTVMDKGAVSLQYAMNGDEGSFSDPMGLNQYAYEDQPTIHAVDVVGWDDNYPREKFETNSAISKMPPKDGAWLIRNSFGAWAGKKGYFYMSYYDRSAVNFTSMRGSNKIKYDKDNPAHEFGRAYQYDGVGLGYGRFTSDKKYSQANIFEMAKSDEIKAAAFYNDKENAHVKIDIYKNPEEGNPESGTKAASLDFVQKYAGYHTVALPKGIKVKKGDKISVVIEAMFNKDGKTYWEVLQESGTDENVAMFMPIVDRQAGQTYVKGTSVNGKPLISANTWIDATKLNKVHFKDRNNNMMLSLGNATVKLFMMGTSVIRGTEDLVRLSMSKGNKKYKFGAFAAQEKTPITYKLVKGNSVRVTRGGTLTMLKPGISYVKLSVKDTKQYYGTSKTVKIIITK